LNINPTKVIVTMPAYNAAKTLKKTYSEIPKKYVDHTILVDDASTDRTVEIAKEMGLEVIVHPRNRGYGGNQKTCYDNALKQGADIVVMVHPDYQYDPSVIPQMLRPIKEGKVDIMFGSRMVYKKDALRGGMPIYKFIANIFLTFMENWVFGLRLSEYHTGLRAYSREFLESIDYHACADGFVFDTEIVALAVKKRFKIGEVPIRTRYQKDSSSITFRASVKYGLLTLNVLRKYLVSKKEPVGEKTT